MNSTLPNFNETLKGIKQLCEGKNFTEEELRHRARLAYLINRLDFFDELPILLEELMYQRNKDVVKKLKPSKN